MMRYRFLVVGTLLFLAACGTPEAPEAPAVPADDAAHFTYSAYDPDAVFGHAALLFFSHPGDPFSRGTEKTLQSLYESGSPSVRAFRVDYPSSTGARLKYGVVTEDTVVLVSASGARLRAILHPTTEELTALVTSGDTDSSPSSTSS